MLVFHIFLRAASSIRKWFTYTEKENISIQAPLRKYAVRKLGLKVA